MKDDERFLKVLQFLADGYVVREIAEQVGLSHQVMKNLLARYYQETGTDNQHHLVAWAFRNHKVT